MSFRQGVILPQPTTKRTPKKPTQIRVKTRTFLSLAAATKNFSIKKAVLHLVASNFTQNELLQKYFQGF